MIRKLYNWIRRKLGRYPKDWRLLSADEFELLQREPYYMFKPIGSVLNKSRPLSRGLTNIYLFNEGSDYIEVPAEDIKFEGDFTF